MIECLIYFGVFVIFINYRRKYVKVLQRVISLKQLIDSAKRYAI